MRPIDHILHDVTQQKLLDIKIKKGRNWRATLYFEKKIVVLTNHLSEKERAEMRVSNLHQNRETWFVYQEEYHPSFLEKIKHHVNRKTR